MQGDLSQKPKEAEIQTSVNVAPRNNIQSTNLNAGKVVRKNILQRTGPKPRHMLHQIPFFIPIFLHVLFESPRLQRNRISQQL